MSTTSGQFNLKFKSNENNLNNCFFIIQVCAIIIHLVPLTQIINKLSKALLYRRKFSEL